MLFIDKIGKIRYNNVGKQNMESSETRWKHETHRDRQTSGSSGQDPFEIFVDDTSIILRKYEPSCVFCNGNDDVKQFKGKNVCAACRKELGELQ